MKKDIVIIAPFADLPSETGNCRYFYLANQMAAQEKGNVELIVSSFAHLKKAQRDTQVSSSFPFAVTYIEEPGYRKNVSLRRFYSHAVMGRNLYAYLEKRERPDVILCALPSLDAGKAAADYCRKYHVKFVIDVQDLWPEAFQMVLHIPVLSNILFYPLKRKADDIYRAADEIAAVSQTYATRALSVNTKTDHCHSVYLGTDLQDFDAIVEKSSIEKRQDKFLIAYIGTLGHSYDIKNVIRAVAELNKDHKDIWFVVMGDGPLMEEFQELARSLHSQTYFMGRVPYRNMVEALSVCDAAVNPIAHNAAQSIINKVGDYAAAGLPVVSTQECPEYRSLVTDYQIGFNCENSDVQQLKEKLLLLYNDKELRRKMGANNRKLAKERFDRSHSYQRIIELLDI